MTMGWQHIQMQTYKCTTHQSFYTNKPLQLFPEKFKNTLLLLRALLHLQYTLQWLVIGYMKLYLCTASYRWFLDGRVGDSGGRGFLLLLHLELTRRFIDTSRCRGRTWGERQCVQASEIYTQWIFSHGVPTCSQPIPQLFAKLCTHTLCIDEKRTLRSSQDFNMGLLNPGQMLLPTEPLELWHWSKG